MSNFLSRTVTSAFVNFTEMQAALDNTKLMMTEKQRRMAWNSIDASYLRYADLCDRHGIHGTDQIIGFGGVTHESVDLELTRRQKARSITVARREARVAKGQRRFVEGWASQIVGNRRSLRAQRRLRPMLSS